MADKIESLQDIKSASATAEVKVRKASRDKLGPINDKSIDQYFARPVLKMIINQPFEVANRVNEFDVVCTVKGGGLSGQAGAIKHGISKALNEYEPELRAALKKAGFLTRDDRTVERKKYGKAKARRSYQFSKR